MTNITRRQLIAAEKIAAKKKKNQRLTAGALGAGVLLSATFASAGAATAAPVSVQSAPVTIHAAPTPTATTTTALNMRTAPGVRNKVVLVLPRNAKVQLRGKVSGGWIAVRYNNKAGWVSKAYLKGLTSTASSSTKKTTKVVRTSSTSTATPVTGSWSTAVNFAVSKANDSRVGYVYGGNGPYGYDCSGFTSAIYKTAGKSLARSSKAQYANAPTKTSINNIQVGDLVFWSNNGSGSGVYHVAMYIGNGQIVHARNPSVGISVTALNYSPNNMLGTVGRY